MWLTAGVTDLQIMLISSKARPTPWYMHHSHTHCAWWRSHLYRGPCLFYDLCNDLMWTYGVNAPFCFWRHKVRDEFDRARGNVYPSWAPCPTSVFPMVHICPALYRNFLYCSLFLITIASVPQIRSSLIDKFRLFMKFILRRISVQCICLVYALKSGQES